MDHITPREECVYKPADMRSAYFTLSVFVLIGLLAVAVGIAGPAVSAPLDTQMITASADQVFVAASHAG